MKRTNNKQIILFGMLFAIFIAITLSVIYMFNKPEEVDKELAQPIETPTMNIIERTPEEEKLVVDKIVGDGLQGNPDGYSGLGDIDKYDEKPELSDESFAIYKQNILTLIGGHNLSDAQNIADGIFSEYKITDPIKMGFVVTCQNLADMAKDSYDRIMTITLTSDPELFVLLFAQLTTAEQAGLLSDLNVEVLPSAEAQDLNILSCEEAGPYESLAYKYFSDYDNTIIKKIVIKYENEAEYAIYFATNQDAWKTMITNIEKNDSHAGVRTSYQEYMDLFEIEPYILEYD